MSLWGWELYQMNGPRRWCKSKGCETLQCDPTCHHWNGLCRGVLAEQGSHVGALQWVWLSRSKHRRLQSSTSWWQSGILIRQRECRQKYVKNIQQYFIHTRHRYTRNIFGMQSSIMHIHYTRFSGWPSWLQSTTIISVWLTSKWGRGCESSQCTLNMCSTIHKHPICHSYQCAYCHISNKHAFMCMLPVKSHKVHQNTQNKEHARYICRHAHLHTCTECMNNESTEVQNPRFNGLNIIHADAHLCIVHPWYRQVRVSIKWAHFLLVI